MSAGAITSLILAQTAAAESAASATSVAAERVVYELGRLREFDDPRLAIVLIAVAAVAILGIVWQLYRRDTVELSRPVGIGLATLRCVALAGLLVFFLDIERRTTREVVHNSQVAVLVDGSLSMGLPDGDEAASGSAPSRFDAIAIGLEQTPLLNELRKTHDVNIARFDEMTEPIVSLPKREELGVDNQRQGDGAADPDAPHSTPDAWLDALEPRGAQTRLGQALMDELRRYRDAPLAAVVVLSDGGQNAGIEPSAAVEAAKASRVPIHTIGFGSTRPQRNVALRDVVVPARAFPGDTLSVTGYLQAHGYAGRLVDVELLARRADEEAESGTRIATERVLLAPDGEVVSVSFDLEPDEPGTYVYQLRVVAPPDDGNPRDNQREAEVDVVDRQTRVLLFASGPMRDYQFIRDQLHRDRSMIVDVLLQTAQPGISQDANEILTQFPSTREDLYQYDAIVAFDPDWTELDAEQVALLESWVSEEAGGMIAVAGPIHTGRWVRSTEHSKLRDLYPVVFQQRMSLLDDGHYSGDEAWPIQFERAGREARFLWLETTAEENEAVWEQFPGVYGYYAVRGEKPGATVYARFSDPEAVSGLSESGRTQPVYMAGQFYGAGQVFYLGSGELWRLRSLDPAYFEVLTTKLIRQVSQGRILRGSARGSLMVERDRYELGETVVLRARLSDAQHNPLDEPSVTAHVLRPDGTTEPVALAADEERPGMYVGQLPVRAEGTYQVSLPIPDSNEEPLSRYLQVRVPDLERAHPERNEALLASLAAETGGQYYRRFDGAVTGEADLPPLADAIESRAEVKLLQGAPDQAFARWQMHWLLGIIAGALFIEWIIRRVNRLA